MAKDEDKFEWYRPSELEVAKSADGWRLMAQRYYCAAAVLRSASDSEYKKLHDGKPHVADFESLARLEVDQPALFCMAFALELAIKAVLVDQGHLEEMRPERRLPFASHNVAELARKVDGLTLNADDAKCLEDAGEMIATGRYPVGARPTAAPFGFPTAVRYPKEFMCDAKGIYGRIVRLPRAPHK